MAELDGNDITGRRELPPGELAAPHLHPVRFEPQTRTDLAGGFGGRVRAVLAVSCDECPRWRTELEAHTAPELMKVTLQHSGLTHTDVAGEILLVAEMMTNRLGNEHADRQTLAEDAIGWLTKLAAAIDATGQCPQ